MSFESVRALALAERPEASPLGTALAVASLIVMPLLSRAQRRTGRALGSGTVFADGTQTLLCTYLSAVLLVGLLLNASLGWYWADPLAALLIAGVAVREGLMTWRGDNCCPATLPSATAPPRACGHLRICGGVLRHSLTPQSRASPASSRLGRAAGVELEVRIDAGRDVVLVGGPV